MFILVNKLATQIPKDKPKIAANAIQECLGGKFVKMNTMLQYLFQILALGEKQGPVNRRNKLSCKIHAP